MTTREPLAVLAPGSNRIDLDVAAATDSPQLVATTLSPEGGRPVVAWTPVPVTRRGGGVTHRFEVRETVPTVAQWGVFNTAMQPLYISPRVSIAVRSTVVHLTLSTPGAYEVAVNDSVIATGSSAVSEKIAIALRHGANPIAVRAQAGVATLKLDGTGNAPFAEVWRVKSEGDPEATASDFDDRQWPLVATGQEVDRREKGEPLVFRRTLLSEHTRVWPVPSPALFVARNSTQAATFKFNGLPGRDLVGWTTWIAVPEPLEVTGVTGYYGNYRASQPVFHYERAGKVTIEGRPTPLYRITADAPLVYDRFHPPGGRTGIFHVMLRVNEPAQAGRPAPAERLRLVYWSEADRGATAELPQSFAVHLLPPLNGRQPKTFVFRLTGSNLGTMDSEDVRRQALETMQQAGFNFITDAHLWSIRNGVRYGIKTLMMLHFTPWSVDLGPHLAAHLDQRLVNASGQRVDGRLCTTLLVGEAWPEVEKVLHDLLVRHQPASVYYDYEYSPFKGPHACFCGRCLEAFRTQKSIPEGVSLNASTIEESYRTHWEDFMARRAARIMKRLREGTRKALPGVLFNVFSLPQSQRTVSVYGVDWRYVVREKGADVVTIGTSGPWKEMVRTSQVVGEIPITYGIWLKPYGPLHEIAAQVATRAELLRRALDSTYGVMIYDRNVLDGRSWRNIGETTRLVADFEDLFLHSHPEAVEGHDPEQVQWLRGKEKQLLCIMNNGTSAADFSIPLPGSAANGYDYDGTSKVGDATTLHLTVPPGGRAVYVFDVRQP